MTDKTYEAIVSALDRLASGHIKTKNGKVTAVTLAAAAGVSKATLYRYFDEHRQLRGDYEAVRRRGLQSIEQAPGTLQEAYAGAQAEIRELRRLLSEAEVAAKVKAQQLLLLWSENRALQRELERRKAPSAKSNNITPLANPDH